MIKPGDLLFFPDDNMRYFIVLTIDEHWIDGYLERPGKNVNINLITSFLLSSVLGNINNGTIKIFSLMKTNLT